VTGSNGPRGRARLLGFVALLLAASALAPRPAAAASSPAGSETFDVYRPGVYSMQATWTWCTAASVQIIRNILLDQTDHSSAQQGQFFAYMQAANRYRQPSHRAVDPQGFLAGLRQFVDPSYTLVASPTFDAAVRSAVTQLRLTGEPVALIVAAGRHAWVLTGFTATADPAVTTNFGVVSVRVVGPLYGRQSINGYDSPPDTSLSYSALRGFLLPYRFPFSTTPWTGRYLTFQAVPAQLGELRRPLAV
jgi:Spy/CpxP family protein refolding chaperone